MMDFIIGDLDTTVWLGTSYTEIKAIVPLKTGPTFVACFYAMPDENLMMDITMVELHKYIEEETVIDASTVPQISITMTKTKFEELFAI